MIEVQLVGEAIAGESTKVRKELDILIETLNKSTFDVAELLHRVKRNKYYVEYGFDTFAEFYKSLNIKSRKAQYLERIVDVMTACDIDRNTYEPLGTNRLRDICRLDPQGTYTNPATGEETPMREFITGLVGKAPELTRKELKTHVNTLLGFVGETDIVNMTFGWTRQAKEETIDKAIELARRSAGSSGRDDEGNAVDISPSRCVEIWAIEFINDIGNQILSEEESK